MNMLPTLLIICCLLLQPARAVAQQAVEQSAETPPESETSLTQQPTDSTAPAANSAESPASTIDRLIAARWSEAGLEPTADCSDEVFARRLHLDLCGRIPTPAEMSTFLQDSRPDRRLHLVDHLLQSEDYVQHFADNLDTLLMGRNGRRAYQQRQQHQWRAWLESIIRDNRPWDDCVRTILLARPEDERDRGAIWFLYERNNNFQKIAEELAPAFFGIRIECAQCHDHMVASEIEQAHYWGLVAFFNRGTNADTPRGVRIKESAIGGFSEFANLEGDSTPNLLTFFAAATVPEERPADAEKQEDKEDLYQASEIDGEPRIPVFSRRQAFVDQILLDHPLVARAFVNRIWALLLGRGIVHPFDEMDSVHPPSHPQLLDALAEDFRGSGYDIRRLIRSIALSRVYQLDSRRPQGGDDPATFAWGLEKPLTAEQYVRSLQIALRSHSQPDEELLDGFRGTFPELLPETITTGVDDALFLANNSAITGFIAASTAAEHLPQRISSQGDLQIQIQTAWLAVFARAPAADEIDRVQSYLQASTPDTLTQRWQQVLWAMLTSAEFRYNH